MDTKNTKRLICGTPRVMMENALFRHACELLETNASGTEEYASALKTLQRLVESALNSNMRKRAAAKIDEIDALEDAQYEHDEGQYDGEV